MSISFNHYTVDTLHLEATDVCNAACPLCARETDPDFNPDVMHHLSVPRLIDLFDESWLASLQKVYLCGNYGDPAAGKYTLDILKYFKSLNPEIITGINTNGSLRDPDWWAQLAQIQNQPQDYVVFSIDGLSDTNHIYRVNTVWDKIMENSQAFIQHGGSAQWDMLVYRHNEHQVDQCQEMAKTLGFKWFRAKVSKRPLASGLERPVQWIQPTKSSGVIVCQSKQENSLYVDCRGVVYPCCWQAYSGNTIDQYHTLEVSWNTIPDVTCDRICRSSDGNHNIFKDQWQRSVEFAKF